MPIASVVSASGGAGKTTLALLLGYYVATHAGDPRSVQLVDLDPTAGLSLRAFGDEGYVELCRKRKSLYHLDLDWTQGVAVDVDKYAERPGSAAPAISNVAILPPGEDESGDMASRVDDWFRYGDRERLLRLLKESHALEKYKYVIVDTAPFFDVRYSIAAIAASNVVLIPLRPTVTDLVRTKRMVEKLKKAGITNKPILFIFNYDKDKFRQATATLVKLGFYVYKHGGTAQVQKRLMALIEDLGRYGQFAKAVLPHIKQLSDSEFPANKIPEGDLYTCPAMAEIFRHLAPDKTPDCPAHYEEE